MSELYACIQGERLRWEGGSAEAVRGKTTVAQVLAGLLRD